AFSTTPTERAFSIRIGQWLTNDRTETRKMSSSGNLISVVMPVYNALPHLDAAVRSILDQTFRDFEFVIYDDGSTDGSAERLRDWAARDPRIRLIEGKHNLGPAGSSAVVVEQA